MKEMQGIQDATRAESDQGKKLELAAYRGRTEKKDDARAPPGTSVTERRDGSYDHFFFFLFFLASPGHSFMESIFVSIHRIAPNVMKQCNGIKQAIRNLNRA